MSSNEIQIINLPEFQDDRGTFTKLLDVSHPVLIGFHVKQINHVVNPKSGIFRGLHFQQGEFAEAKLFRVTQGAIQLVAFCWDKRLSTYRQSFSLELKKGTQSVFIPRGWATGYLVLLPNSHVLYMSDNFYEPSAESGVRWNDSALKAEWHLPKIETSVKDQTWRDFETN